jgi:ribosomal protein S27E
MRMKPSDFVQKYFMLQGKPFSIKEFPYLEQIYNSPAREIGLFTARQIAKSTTLGSLLVSNAVAYAGSSQILVSPLQEQAVVFSTTRLKDFLVDSPLIYEGFFNGPQKIDQVLRKRLTNGSIITLGYAARSADRMRGRSILSGNVEKYGAEDKYPRGGLLGFDESVVGGTDILTPSGMMKIENLRVGDVVNCYDMETLTPTHDTIVTTFDHGERLVWKLVFSDGSVLTCTSASRLATELGWVYVHELVDTALVPVLGVVPEEYIEARFFQTYNDGDIVVVHERDRTGGVDTVNKLQGRFYPGTSTTLPKFLGNISLVSIECSGYQRVYDIETATHHNFFANGVCIHNCQDILPEVIPVLKEMAFRTKNPRFLHAGTPKSMSNPMEGLRRRSTGFEWAVKCEACNKWNLEWTEANIGNTNVICQYCGKHLNTAKGQWVAKRRLDIDKGKDATVTLESYRIPQLIVKPIMDDPFKWIELLEKLRTYSTEKFKNEVLGLPHDSGSNPVTEAQLHACCIRDRENTPPTQNNYPYPPLVMGVDWAFTAENSYTYVVIGGWNPFPSKFEVFYHKIYKGNESDSLYQIEDIIRLFHSTGCRLISADWGCGHVQNLSLIKALGEDRVMQVWHTGMQTKAGGRQRAKWEPKTRKYHLARTAVLTDTFETIKRKQVTFPKSEDCKTLFDHILAESMEYKPETNTTKYVNIDPDDGLHALTYAMLGGELLMTGDFRGHAGSSEILPQSVGAPDLQDGWPVSDDMYS